MNRRFWHIWTIPIMLAILSLFGLISALIGDGFMDFLSWITLGIPLVVVGWFMNRASSESRKR
jgi:uncharacterized membrane protein